MVGYMGIVGENEAVCVLLIDSIIQPDQENDETGRSQSCYWRSQLCIGAGNGTFLSVLVCVRTFCFLSNV